MTFEEALERLRKAEAQARKFQQDASRHRRQY
jgi:hypothetical protein